MNFFEIFNKKEYQNTTIIKTEEKSYSIQEVLELTRPIVFKLQSNTTKNALILSENNFNFLINFIAAIFARKEIFLLSDPKKLFLIDFDYILLDKVFPATSQNIELKNVDTDNTLINIFTSGSSGTPKQITKTLTNIITEADDIYHEYKKYLPQEKTEVISSTSPHHMFGLTCYIVLPLYLCEKFLVNTKEIVYPEESNLNKKLFISTPSFLDKYKQHNINLSQKPAIILTAGDKLKEETYEYFKEQSVDISDIYGSSEVGVIAHKENPNAPLSCYRNVTIDADKNSQITVFSPYFREEKLVLGDKIEKLNDKTFVLKNRTDRIIKIQEKRLNAMEIEDYINTTGYIENSYCFKYGEKLVCAAVLNKSGINYYTNHNGGRTKLIKELKSIIKTKSEIVPQKWKFLYEIPKTKTGKTNKEKIENIFSQNLSIPLILNVTKKDSNNLKIDLVFSRTCNFFKGHFDDFPILPGVVQFYFAHTYAEEMFGIPVQKSPVKKVKFSHIIKPDEIIELNLQKSEQNINYTYKKGELICSSGTFSIQE